LARRGAQRRPRPDVDWLAKRLSQIYDLPKPQDNQPLDATLRKR
jgi:general secretion pathway protein A